MEKEKWIYKGKMEDMKGDELRERIQKAMDFEIPNKIAPMPYLGGLKETAKYSTKELVAKCPVTGIMDLYTIEIEMIPDKLIPELKSLKFYYMAYQDLPIGHEHLLAKIFKEFKKVISPLKLKITLYVAIRGGIETIVTHEEEK
uniref:Putative 7-cyano-7-deazaguanine reductase n=1 Tax=viral metagenome TaxID=1070528 RepID=A0A6M3LG12_9ZZZZ